MRPRREVLTGGKVLTAQQLAQQRTEGHNPRNIARDFTFRRDLRSATSTDGRSGRLHGLLHRCGRPTGVSGTSRRQRCPSPEARRPVANTRQSSHPSPAQHPNIPFRFRPGVSDRRPCRHLTRQLRPPPSSPSNARSCPSSSTDSSRPPFASSAPVLSLVRLVSSPLLPHRSCPFPLLPTLPSPPFALVHHPSPSPNLLLRVTPAQNRRPGISATVPTPASATALPRPAWSLPCGLARDRDILLEKWMILREAVGDRDADLGSSRCECAVSRQTLCLGWTTASQPTCSSFAPRCCAEMCWWVPLCKYFSYNVETKQCWWSRTLPTRDSTPSLLHRQPRARHASPAPSLRRLCLLTRSSRPRRPRRTATTARRAGGSTRARRSARRAGRRLRLRCL